MTPFGLIFDMDGVLVDSAASHLASWRRLGEELGVAFTDDQFFETFGRRNEQVIPMLLGDRFTADEITELGERKEAYYRETMSQDVPVCEGAVDLIRECQSAGVAMAVGSSGHPLNIQLLINSMSVKDAIRTIVSGHDVSNGKPDPEVFLKAAVGLQMPPRHCVVIEDAPSGIEAALNGGFAAVGVTTNQPACRLDHAHVVVGSLTELSAARLGEIVSIHTRH